MKDADKCSKMRTDDWTSLLADSMISFIDSCEVAVH